MPHVNSHDYWDHRFRTDWETLGGEAQSRFFAEVALKAMPQWFRACLAARRHTLHDWGCAEGAGTRALAETLHVDATGVDFSSEAIARAQVRHAGVHFRVGDLLAQPGEGDAGCDIAFSSNTLEHFRDPWAAFDALAARARRFVVLLLPYREVALDPEHFVAFAPEVLPIARNGWVLVHAAAMDVADWPHSAWQGEQMLCIYARPHAVAEAGVTVASLRIDTSACEEAQQSADAAHRAAEAARKDAGLVSDQLRFEAARGRAAEEARAWTADQLSDRELQLAALGEAHRDIEATLPRLQRDAADLARIRASRAWRWSASFRRWLR